MVDTIMSEWCKECKDYDYCHHFDLKSVYDSRYNRCRARAQRSYELICSAQTQAERKPQTNFEKWRDELAEKLFIHDNIDEISTLVYSCLDCNYCPAIVNCNDYDSCKEQFASWANAPAGSEGGE
jgi:hypothetical protein